MTNVFLFGPELYYLLMAAVFFALSLGKNVQPKRCFSYALILSALGAVLTILCARQQGTLFFEAYRVDLFSQVFKSLLAIGTFWAFFVCSNIKDIDEGKHAEFYMLLSVCTTAMMMLVSAVELLTIYIAIELSSYSLYILVNMRRGRSKYAETGVKYFMIGSVASAFMLFGLSYIYGVTGSTYISDIMAVFPDVMYQPAAIIGVLLALSGFFFKQALFPFHTWAPDVYEGSNNQVATYIATTSKMAAAAMIIRFVGLCSPDDVLVKILMALCICSMFFGNLVALIQKDMKRLLAYSSIAHAGYLLIGVLSMSERGYSSAIYYAMAYLVMNFAVFMVVVKLSEDGSNLKIKELAGLHKRSPLLAMTFMMGLFGLAGIPPTVGFMGKFYVFAAAVEQGYLLLAVLGMVNATISLYYYMIVIKAAYLMQPVQEYPKVETDTWTKGMSLALVAIMIWLCIFPERFVELTEAAARSLL